MSYESGQPQVYLLQIETGQRELVGNFPGMTFAPRFSPDGQKVIMSLLRDDGNSNIFAMDLRQPHDDPAHQLDRRSTPRRPIRRTAARWCSPPTAAAAPQIYVMDADGSGQKPHLLRRRRLFDAGVVAARRPHRLHQADRRRVPDRRDAHRRLRRAHPVRPASSRRARPGRRTAAC